MIGWLAGRVAAVRGERLLLDVSGVGYEISMTPKTIAGLPALGEPIAVHTHLYVREDEMRLYGFATEADRDLFRVLLTASGVGPRVGLAILGVFSADALRRVVASEDADALCQVPGVGKRSAQKIILDLKPKLTDLEAEVLEAATASAQLRQALDGLGYSPAEIRRVLPGVDSTFPVAEQIRQALQELGR